MISVERVTKRYGPLTAVDDISFEIDRGEVVGFLGPNGAGKSTTMKILTGALQPDEGLVEYDGRSIGDDVTAARARVGYLPETNALYPEMLVSEYLTYAGELRGLSGASFRGSLRDAVDRTGVGAVFTRPVSELSKGYRQRVGLAAAILHEPEILVLDEPTEGLDPNQRVGIRSLITELGQERTVVLSTHVMAEVEATCSRLLILRDGRLVADGTVRALLEGQRAGAIYLVEAKGEGIEETLAALPGVILHGSEPVEGRIRVRLDSSSEQDLRPLIFRAATERGWTLWELHRERANLETLFRSLTEEEEDGEGGRGGSLDGGGTGEGSREAGHADGGGGTPEGSREAGYGDGESDREVAP